MQGWQAGTEHTAPCMNDVTVGTLVRWYHPRDTCFGIVLEVPTQEGESAMIHWASKKNPHKGRYPLDHRWMQIISK